MIGELRKSGPCMMLMLDEEGVSREDLLGALEYLVPTFSDKARHLFGAVGWSWGDSLVPPSSKEIEEKLLRQIGSLAAQRKLSRTESGGLVVEVDEGEGFARLGFQFSYHVWS